MKTQATPTAKKILNDSFFISDSVISDDKKINDQQLTMLYMKTT